MTYLNQQGAVQESQKIASMLESGESVEAVAKHFGQTRNEFLEAQISKFALYAVHYTEE